VEKKVKNSLVKKETRILKAMKDEEFIAPLKEKTGEEIRQIIFEAWDISKRNIYYIIRGLRALELTGKFKEIGFKTFNEALAKIVGLSSTTYYSYLQTARRFPQELIEKIGFPTLAGIVRKKLSINSQIVIKETIERRIETTGELPARQEVREIISRLAPPEEQVPNGFRKINYLEKEIKDLRHENLILKKKIRDGEEEIQKLKNALDDERKYREDIQKGKRAI